MKVAVLGATGNVGSVIVGEALDRGHQITGISRHPDKAQPHPHLTAKQGDVLDTDGLAKLMAGHEAVISSVRFGTVTPMAQKLFAALKQAGVKRFLVVGGAGSMEVKPGLQLVDTPDFPPAYKNEALAGREFLNIVRGEQELEWTFLSPSAELVPGQRTGKFRLGLDQLLVGSDGKSWISRQDFAVALIDELEKPKHVCRRFTVGY